MIKPASLSDFIPFVTYKIRYTDQPDKVTAFEKIDTYRNTI